MVLLGDSGVGKSSIVLRFVADNFKGDEDATIGASFMGKMMQFNEKSIKFNIWDTAGQDRYHTLAKMYYRDAQAAILVYDITKSASFHGLKRWNEELSENGPKDLIKVVAGNKEDLVEAESVNPAEACEFAEEIGAIYKKTSAKTNYGIEQAFKEIASRVYPGVLLETRPRPGSLFLTKEANSQQKKRKGCC